MNIIKYRTYVVAKTTSNDSGQLDLRLSFDNDNTPVLDIHARLSSGLTVQQTAEVSNPIDEQTSQSLNKSGEDFVVKIMMTLRVIINGSLSIRYYELNSKLSSTYGAILNLETIIDVDGNSLAQEKNEGRTVLFNDSSNCNIEIITKNLNKYQSHYVELAVRENDRTIFVDGSLPS